MKLIIDRMENGTAVVELPEETWWRVPRTLLPKDAKEGDVLSLEGHRLALDIAETSRLREQARLQLDRLARSSMI